MCRLSLFLNIVENKKIKQNAQEKKTFSWCDIGGNDCKVFFLNTFKTNANKQFCKFTFIS